jgi:ABC-type transport system involved in multi-copper enzyme maturation permease subunit
LLWLTWRQHRTQTVVTGTLLLVLGVVLLANGLGAADTGRFESMYTFVSSLILVPVVVGVFWGAPLLAKEFERGTHKLMWTQSVSRGRWLTAKLGGIGVVVALGGLVFGLMVEAWLGTFPGKSRPLDDMALFSLVGVVSVAWWLFAFVLGAAAGAVVRKTLPAIGVTIAVSAAVLIGLVFLRPFYMAPERVELTGHPPDTQTAYITKMLLVAPDGREYDLLRPPADCPSGPDQGRCFDAAGYRNFVEFQPYSRFWQFQWTEAGILFAGTLLLGAVAVRSGLRRRV